VVGDLTSPVDVANAIDGVTRMFFNMSVAADYLEAAAVVAAVGKEVGALDVLVNMSQMTVSQMTLTSTEESHHQRLHWLAERVLNWSDLPVVHVRPTVFLDNPLFTVLGAASVRERGVLALPFGDGHTSPIAAADVAHVVATLLREPDGRLGHTRPLDDFDRDACRRRGADAADARRSATRCTADGRASPRVLRQRESRQQFPIRRDARSVRRIHLQLEHEGAAVRDVETELHRQRLDVRNLQSRVRSEVEEEDRVYFPASRTSCAPVRSTAVCVSVCRSPSSTRNTYVAFEVTSATQFLSDLRKPKAPLDIFASTTVPSGPFHRGCFDRVDVTVCTL